MSVTLLSAHELHFAYGNQALLKDVSFGIESGEKVGLVGRNGCGKTSLFKILAGVQSPDTGDVVGKRGLRLGYLPQEFELDPNRTVRENIESGAADLVAALRLYESGAGTEAELDAAQHLIEVADGWNLDTRIKADAHALGVPPLDAPVGPLSGGEKRRVALCRALVGQPDLLLLDEPTNHLDAESIRWLENFLRSFPGAVMFITHDRYFLDVIATRILELDQGNAYSHAGNYTAYLESRAIRQGIAEQNERRRQRFLKAELEWVRAGVRARTTKSKHRLDQYYAAAGQDAPAEERDLDLLIPPPPEIGNVAIELTDAGAKVGDNRWLFRHLNLTLRPGECTGIVGRNGVGKTTLLRLCLGERAPDEGTATIGKKVAFNSIDQNRLKLNGSGTVISEVEDSDGFVHFGDQKISVRGYLRRYLFTDSRVNEKVAMLSGGERARLLLAKVLKRGGNVLVFDEPTNDLDLASLRMLEEALADFDGAVLVVSHDRYFLDRICDQIVAFEDDGIHVQRGNYSYYLEKQANRQPTVAISTPVESVPAPRPVGSRPRKLTNKEKTELAGMEATLFKLESRVTEIEATLNDPTFFVARSTEADGLLAEVESTKKRIHELYLRWEELEAIPKN